MPKFGRGHVAYSSPAGLYGVIVYSWPTFSSTQYLLAQISPEHSSDPFEFALRTYDFAEGTLAGTAYVHPVHLFMRTERQLELVGRFTRDAIEAVLDSIHDALDEQDDA